MPTQFAACLRKGKVFSERNGVVQFDHAAFEDLRPGAVREPFLFPSASGNAPSIRLGGKINDFSAFAKPGF
jgi:hypothetical protein